jgi:hypothetical protein
MFVAAAALYIGGALGMEMVGGYIASTTGKNLSYVIGLTIEESLEMLGIVVFIHALMSYIKTYLNGGSWNINIPGGGSWNINIPGKNTEVTEN